MKYFQLFFSISFIVFFVGCVGETTVLSTVTTTEDVTTSATENTTTDITTVTTTEVTTETTTVELIDTEKINFQYSIYSTVDVIIWEDIPTDDLYIENSNFETINIDEVLILDGPHLEIKSSYLLEQNLGMFSFYLIYDGYRTLVEIGMNDKTDPYIITSTVIYTSGTEDVYLQFELFNGSFYSLNGSRDDVELYHLEGSILTVEKEYIAQKFEGDKIAFTLSYVLNKDNSSVIGYLFIYEEE